MTNKVNIQKKILSNNDAARYIGCAPNSLKISRGTGRLLSVPSPAYLKIGTTIRYKLSTLDKWLEQFTEQQNTAQ